MNGDAEERAAEFEGLRPRLFAIAYRMLGSASEAEDAVQDAYLRWNAADTSAIEVPAAWLTTVLTNLCLTRLTSARATREHYVGAWLPEPVLTGTPAAGGPGIGPLETAEQRESVSLALLSLMERLTPAERAVFVLREAFAYPHSDIAGILGITPEASRQLYRRGRQRVAEDRRRFEPSERRWHDVVEKFLDAARGGDIAALEALLAEDAVSWSDGGGKVRAARHPVHGRQRVARLLAGIAGQATRDHTIGLAEVNGVPAILVLLDGEPAAVLAPEVVDGRVAAIRSTVNPDKLAFLARQLRSEG
ncbi:RNA polymerase sigma-70 factor [Nocardiopsis sediminis]|uniref:RNA polymerase sigma-70 factor n=1 Tax=Nocardiopsis sediminis TaxID=1778267 RepID=A0ABV8FWY5_9ACTN